MKQLNQYIKERLIINKDYKDVKIVVKSFDELRKIIEDRYDKLGQGTKQNPIDFNDIDVSNLDSFYDKMQEDLVKDYFYLKTYNLNTLIYHIGMFQISSQ